MLRAVPGVILAISVSLASAQGWTPPAGHPTLLLWPSGAPGPQTARGAEHNITGPGDRLVAGRPVLRLGDVAAPSITLYAAAGSVPHPAVLVFPGGGYDHLAFDLEGIEPCAWLNSLGVSCVLLKYRVPNTGPFPRSASALQDAQRAMGLVRQHATPWHIDSKRIGVLGFSAGGHLAAALSTHTDRLYPAVDAADRLSCRPDFALMVYPAYLTAEDNHFAFSPNLPVGAAVPPTFLVQAEDDPVHVENAVEYFLALKAAGIPAELHVYAQGGHGYGLRPTALPITHWPQLAATWLHTIGILAPAK